MTPNDTAPIVLIVDDMPFNVKVLRETLKCDYRVEVAGNGAEALERARGEPQPDLILLDVMMPDMDGYEVCRQLKSDPLTAAIPVIFVTAKDDEADQEQGFELGGIDYITKPFSLAVVKMRVRTHIQLKRQTDALERLAYADPLTGIPNRRQFLETLEREYRRALREDSALSVLMIDVDHFKAYNDHYGHGAGDDCLRQVATALARALFRPGDLIARYGGEEFVAVLPQTDREAAAMLAERLRQAVLDLDYPHARSSTGDRVTVSIGGATTSLHAAADSLEALLAQADQMLYRAKDGGRNRCVVADAVQCLQSRDEVDPGAPSIRGKEGA